VLSKHSQMQWALESQFVCEGALNGKAPRSGRAIEMAEDRRISNFCKRIMELATSN
jgi:hypothetical protein